MNWKKPFYVLIGAAFLLTLAYGLGRYHALTPSNPPVQVYFSPNGGCTDAIVKEIDNAKSEILVQAYSFTSTAIAKALLNAHKRGVKVEAVSRMLTTFSGWGMRICFVPEDDITEEPEIEVREPEDE